ncbi:MAG: hypothetical protein RL660_1060 [Bacteroidota bacterium]
MLNTLVAISFNVIAKKKARQKLASIPFAKPRLFSHIECCSRNSRYEMVIKGYEIYFLEELYFGTLLAIRSL